MQVTPVQTGGVHGSLLTNHPTMPEGHEAGVMAERSVRRATAMVGGGWGGEGGDGGGGGGGGGCGQGEPRAVPVAVMGAPEVQGLGKEPHCEGGA